MWTLLLGGLKSYGVYLLLAAAAAGAYAYAHHQGYASGQASRQSEIDDVVSQHAAQVAAAAAAEAAQQAKYREIEAARDAEILTLQLTIQKASDERKAADARAFASRRLLDSAETRYLAAQASRAAANPASACRINDESVAMFRELHRQSDELAGETGAEADRVRDTVIGLRAYVTNVCHN